MTTKVNSNLKDQAKAKLGLIQKSPKYRSFFNADAIAAFTQVESSAFAGKSLKKVTVQDDAASRC